MELLVDAPGFTMLVTGRTSLRISAEQVFTLPHEPARVTDVWPSRAEPRQSGGAIGRGSVIGFVLGIPANATMAVNFGALLIQGVSVGPQLVEQNPEPFWGVVNSMYVGNVLLLIMSIPMVGLFVRILRVRPAVLAPITVLITLIGAYTVNNSVFDIALVVAFGALGYLMKKCGFDPGPLVLAFVLGSLLEESLRRSLLIFDGDPTGSSRAPSRARCSCCSSSSPCFRRSRRPSRAVALPLRSLRRGS